MNKPIALKCRIRAGAFSGEKVYTLKLANGTERCSLVPTSHCWTVDGKPIGPNEPVEEIDGMVEARFIQRGPHPENRHSIWVEVPAHMDSESIAIHENLVVPRPGSPEARIAELEAIVRALAEMDPVIEIGQDGISECALCEEFPNHDDDCPWLRARKALGMEGT